MYMSTLQIFIQTIWASIFDLGLLKLVIFIIVEGILFRISPWLGFLGFILFVAYLAHWI